MKAIRTILAVLLLGAASMARATDFSDLWWTTNESGWGVNVAHQDNLMFITFFIYAQDKTPTWVHGSSVVFQGNNSSGNPVYTGKLYRTTGPWFGTNPFPSSEVTLQEVGEVTFTANGPNDAILTYTISGTPVTKTISRIGLRVNSQVNGNYLGGYIGTTSNCGASNGNFEVSVLVGVTGNTQNTQMVIQTQVGSCTVNGPYVQWGRMGKIVGNISCTGGASGTVTVTEIEADAKGLLAKLEANYTGGCRESVRFGGTRR